MDIVVKKVLDAAIEVSQKAVSKMKNIADESRVTSDTVKKVVDYSKKQFDKATGCASSAKSKFKKHVQDAYKTKCSCCDVGEKVNDMSQKVSKEIKHRYGEVEKQKMYYDLGKLIYRQTIENDSDKYANFIVDKISKIAKQNNEEEKLHYDNA